MFFVCLSGTLVAIWCVARYLKPIGVFALIDGWGRVWISLLIVWFVAVEGAPRVLLLFIVTEMIGAVAQLHEVYLRKPRGRAGRRLTVTVVQPAPSSRPSIACAAAGARSFAPLMKYTNASRGRIAAVAAIGFVAGLVSPRAQARPTSVHSSSSASG